MKIAKQLSIAFILSFALDTASKYWAEQALTLYQPVPFLGETFRFTLGYNTGIAFSLLTNSGNLPLILTGCVIIWLTYWFLNSLYTEQLPPSTSWAIGLLMGGAIGNFVDRLFDGRVTDFLDVGIGTSRWPTFNLADSFIFAGAILLMIITFSHQPDTLEDDEPLSEDPSTTEPTSDKDDEDSHLEAETQMSWQ
ncbi:MAG: signal peptidase II [Chloroflexota bacterium]